MNKMVIFDLDGTLLDTLDDLHDSVNYALRTNNFPERTLEEVRSFVGNGIRLLIERSVPDNTSNELINKTFECFKTYYGEHCNDKTRIYPGVLNVLKQLKERNYKIAVLSNKAQYAVTRLCNIYFSDILDDAIGAQENVRKKPEPDALYKCAEKHNIGLNNIIYVGDSDVDILTARNAGVKGIAVSWGFRTKDFLISNNAERIADTPEELLNMLL